MGLILQSKLTRLKQEFFAQPTLQVAESLIGQGLYCQGTAGIITETEAYVGEGDPACHAARGKTPRNAMLFAAPGTLYVYFIYGMHYCVNIVTEREGFAAGVLIRGLFIPDTRIHLNGPGKLCKALGIDKTFNGKNTLQADDCFFFQTPHRLMYATTPRIGISKGQDKLWRFSVEKKSLSK